jgi:drug/metabolite transporter (DMT)-like permease
MGIAFGLGCALFWSLAVILLKRTGEVVGPFSLNLFRVIFSLPLILITMAVARVPLVPAHAGPALPALIASGVLGIAVGDTLFHKSLNMIGAGITAILDTFYSPSVVLLAYLILGERLGIRSLLGMVLIMGAVFLSATLTPPAGRTHRQLVVGILIGLVGLSVLATGIVIAKPALNQTPVLWVTGVRQAASGIVLLAAGLASPRRREVFRVFRPSPAWKTMVPATFLGSYLSLFCWLAATKFTLVGVAAILTQASTLFILVFAVIFLQEKVTRRKVLSALLALAGVLLVSLP